MDQSIEDSTLVTYIAPGIEREVELVMSFDYDGERQFVVVWQNDSGQPFFAVRDRRQLKTLAQSKN